MKRHVSFSGKGVLAKLVSIVACLVFGISCTSVSPKSVASQQIPSSSLSPSLAPVEQGYSSESIISSLPSSSSTLAHNNFNEKEFKDFMTLFCRFINDPVVSSEGLREKNLFPLLVHLAETYANLQDKSYATQENISSYRFPLTDLQRLSNFIFGFDFNFESAKTLSYIDQDGKTINSFDPATNEFFVIFADAPYPVRDDGLLVSLVDILTLEHAENSITAICQLEYSYGLGTSSEIKNISYHFEIIAEDGVVYYQFKAVE